MEFIITLVADIMVFPVVIIGAVALLWYVPNKNKFEAYSRVLLSGLTAFFVAKLMAFIYQPHEARPFELLGVSPGASYLDNPGFPSDHALFVVAILLACAAEVRRPWLTAVLFLLCLAVCVGRVLALVHTPLDVVGGVSAALLGGVWYLLRPGSKTCKK